MCVCVCVLWPLHICNQPIPQSVSSRQCRLIQWMYVEYEYIESYLICWYLFKCIHIFCFYLRGWMWQIWLSWSDFRFAIKQKQHFQSSVTYHGPQWATRPALCSASSMTEATDWMPVATTWPRVAIACNLPCCAHEFRWIFPFGICSIYIHSLWLTDLLLAGRRLGTGAAFEEIDDKKSTHKIYIDLSICHHQQRTAGPSRYILLSF